MFEFNHRMNVAFRANSTNTSETLELKSVSAGFMVRHGYYYCQLECPGFRTKRPGW